METLEHYLEDTAESVIHEILLVDLWPVTGGVGV
jgi:hypothetical protein